MFSSNAKLGRPEIDKKKLIFFLSKANHSNFATDHQFALLVIRILKEKMLANRDFVTSASCVPDA